MLYLEMYITTKTTDCHKFLSEMSRTWPYQAQRLASKSIFLKQLQYYYKSILLNSILLKILQIQYLIFERRFRDKLFPK